MKKNKLKQIFSEGKAAVNGWLQIPSSFSAEVMAHQGWDSLTIDMQHGVIDYPNALQMLQAISTTDVVPMVRLNWNEPGQIMKILDAGSYGVICPMVNNREEAEKFVQACLYPPKGYRSLGPIRGLLYGGPDYDKHEGKNIDWSTAESLAFATLLNEGYGVRLSGQDTGRGTFSQRHSVLYDQINEKRFVPLRHFMKQQGYFEIIDSFLSEYGVLGFEYGYS